MKKTYNIPVMKVIKIQTVLMQTGSPVTSGLTDFDGYGGTGYEMTADGRKMDFDDDEDFDADF